MPDYSNGKIYRIVCNETGEQYIGSTTQSLAQRLTQHKCHQKCMSRQILERKNYAIVLIEECPCENKEQLGRRERHYIESMECINNRIPTRTKREANRAYRETNREKIAELNRAYREANREKIAEQKRAYHEANREKLTEKTSAYYEANREKVLEQTRAYREANREKLLEKARAYREANREKITEQQRARRQAKKLVLGV
jgi:hypothetical protein